MGQLQTRGEDDDDEEAGDEIGLTLSGLDELDGDGDEYVYEFDEWKDSHRALLRERLEMLGVEHRWEGQSVVIAAEDEAWLERVLDQLEEDLSVQLEEDVEQIAYDLSEWDELQREALLELLTEEGVPHGVDGDELFVAEIDEMRTDEMVDRVLDPDRPDRSEIGGQEIMGALFVAADRLRHDPREHAASVAFMDAAAAAGSAAPPYGMDQAWWSDTGEAVSELAELIEDADSDDDLVREQADALRSRLRPYV
jgi:hypothetical protein